MLASRCMRPRSVRRRPHLFPLLFALWSCLLASPARAADKIQVIGSPKVVKFDRDGYIVDPDSGQTFDITGPAPILFGIWSTTPSARVVATIVYDDTKVSTNVVRFRHMPVNRKDGMEYLTLLSFKAFPGTHRYRLKVSGTQVAGTQVAVVPTVPRSFMRQFAAAPWKDNSDEPPKVDTPPSGTIEQPQPETMPPVAISDTPMVLPSLGDADMDGGFPSFDENGGGGGGDSQASAGEKLDAADHILQIGGTMFLRARYFHYEKGSLSSDNISSPNLTDIYLDATPNEVLRGYIRARLKFDPTKPQDQQAQLLVNQLWLKATLYNTVFVTFGQQALKWGTGRFHNPTDFLNRQQRDPFTLFDERVGVPLLKVHVPIESLGWNLYAIASYGGAARPNQVGGALRAEIVLGTAEFALSAVGRRNERPRFGFDLSATLGGIVDIFAEVAVRQGGQTPFYRGDFDPENGIVPETFTRENEWLPQVAAGFEGWFDYSDEDRIRFGAEYFYNRFGDPSGDVDRYAYKILQGTYVPYYEGRHYAGAYIQLPSPGPLADVTFLLNTIGNLDDRSWLSWIDTRYLVMNVLTLSFLVNLHWGDPGEFRLGLDIPAAPDAGVSAPRYQATPYLDFQFGLLMNI